MAKRDGSKRNSIRSWIWDNYRGRQFSSPELAKDLNLTINNASAHLCLMADDNEIKKVTTVVNELGVRMNVYALNRNAKKLVLGDRKRKTFINKTTRSVKLDNFQKSANMLEQFSDAELIWELQRRLKARS